MQQYIKGRRAINTGKSKSVNSDKPQQVEDNMDIDSDY